MATLTKETLHIQEMQFYRLDKNLVIITSCTEKSYQAFLHLHCHLISLTKSF